MGKEIVAASTTDTAEEVQAVVTEQQETPKETPAEETNEEQTVEEESEVAEVETEEAETEEREEAPAPKTRKETPVGEAALEPDEPKSWSKLSRRELAQKRIDRLTWKAKEAERKNEELQRRIDELTKTPKVEEPAAKKEEPKPDPEPKEEDFENYGDYVKALAKWQAREVAREQASKVISENKNEMTREQIMAARKAAVDAHNERVEEFKQTVDDWDDVVAHNTDVNISGVMEAAILASERGPAIVYYLGQHPEEAGRLAAQTLNLGPEGLLLVKDRLEALVPAEAPKKTKTGSVDKGKAKEEDEEEEAEPIKPVGGTPTKTAKNLDEMDLDEYKRVRNKQERERLKTRR